MLHVTRLAPRILRFLLDFFFENLWNPGPNNLPDYSSTKYTIMSTHMFTRCSVTSTSVTATSHPTLLCQQATWHPHSFTPVPLQHSQRLSHLPRSLLLLTFNQSAVCLTTGPQPLPKRHHRVLRCSASAFNFRYPVFSSMLSSSCLRLLLRFPTNFINSSIFPTITCLKRQLEGNM